MANFLDLTTGLPALWAKIKSKFYTKAEVDALIPEDEVMWVHITGSDASFSVDKTFDEIYNHVHSGGVAYADWDGHLYAQLGYIDKLIGFGGCDVTDDGVVGDYFYIEKDSSGNTTISRMYEPINASTTNPLMDGTVSIGSSMDYARADHVHPSDTSRAAVADVLTKTNTTSYTPTADYNPATKKYVDDTVAATTDASAPFIVTITKGYSQGDQEWWYNSNKNYSQIMEAYNAGQTCYAIDRGNLYYLAEAHNAYVLFTRLSVDDKKLYSYKITSSNNNLTYTYMNVPYNLNSLKDVNIYSPTTGQVLTYASSGWKAADIATDLTGLTDTTISSPADGQVLSYDSTTSKWVNTNTLTETRVNELIAAALAQYGDGDTATYGYNDASEVNY